MMFHTHTHTHTHPGSLWIFAIKWPIHLLCTLPTLSIAGDLESGRKVHTMHGGRKGTEAKHKGHTAHVLCMAICTDAKFLVRMLTLVKMRYY